MGVGKKGTATECRRRHCHQRLSFRLGYTHPTPTDFQYHKFLLTLLRLYTRLLAYSLPCPTIETSCIKPSAPSGEMAMRGKIRLRCVLNGDNLVSSSERRVTERTLLECDCWGECSYSREHVHVYRGAIRDGCPGGQEWPTMTVSAMCMLAKAFPEHPSAYLPPWLR